MQGLEKERLAGVFYDERILYEHARTTHHPESLPPRRSHGTGVYMDETEVEHAVHPLQDACQQSHCEHSMYPVVQCPAGQPLVAPPVLATSIVTEENEFLGPPAHKETYLGMWGDGLRYDSLERNNHNGGGDSLWQMKRNALRQRLHSRDYRLSTDELVFVEAAAKLSVPPMQHPGALQQQQLPLVHPTMPQQAKNNNNGRGVPLALPLKKPLLPGNDLARYPIDIALGTQPRY
jgi:hypothetical protein